AHRARLVGNAERAHRAPLVGNAEGGQRTREPYPQDRGIRWWKKVWIGGIDRQAEPCYDNLTSANSSLELGVGGARPEGPQGLSGLGLCPRPQRAPWPDGHARRSPRDAGWPLPRGGPMSRITIVPPTPAGRRNSRRSPACCAPPWGSGPCASITSARPPSP